MLSNRPKTYEKLTEVGELYEIKVIEDVLQQENKWLENKLKEVEGDYQALLQIMEKARKMIVLEEGERSQKVKFKR